jgi:hypothetical protein
MELGDYLTTRRLSLAAFARQVGGVTRSAVHKYVHGYRYPEAAVAERIAVATDGKVTANDMLATWRRAQSGSSPEPRKRGRVPTGSVRLSAPAEAAS